MISLKQAGNESFSEFLAKLKLHGTHAKLETLGIEGLYIYCAIVGLNSANLDLKEKLLELKDLTLPEMDRTAWSWESAQSTIKKMKDTVVVVWPKDTTVSENEYGTPWLRVFCFDHLRHLPKEKMTQMVYHFKALI